MSILLSNSLNSEKKKNDEITINLNWPKLSNENVEIDDDNAFKCKYITRNDQLGDGNFSVVKECMNIHTRELYAMKLIHKKIIKGKLQLIQREFSLLKLLSNQIRNLEKNNNNNSVTSMNTFQGHHHILQLFDFFETCDNIVLITQLCEKDDLYEKIISNSHLDLTRQVVPYTACLTSVLQFLHSQGVVHRDIKAENVLFRLQEGKQNKSEYDLTAHDLILGDFGLATHTKTNNGNTLREYVGTISYISPEIVACKGVNQMLTQEEIDKIQPYDCPVDIWALGVLTFFMAFGYTPFDCETDEETLDCIKKCDYYIDDDFAANPDYKDFWNFIEKCFTVDTNKRPTAQLLAKHPFINKYFNNYEIQMDNEMTSFKPVLQKNKSFSSLHALRTPSRTNSQTSLSSASSSNMDLAQYHRHPTREQSIKDIRDTLRRTLSMTSLKTSNYKVSKGSSGLTIPPTNSNSTFFLDPQPPVSSLMNGVFSETPESLSNFNTTPRTSLSRNSSYKHESNQQSSRLARFDLNFDINDVNSGDEGEPEENL